jgi:hypothetical protein
VDLKALGLVGFDRLAENDTDLTTEARSGNVEN